MEADPAVLEDPSLIADPEEFADPRDSSEGKAEGDVTGEAEERLVASKPSSSATVAAVLGAAAPESDNYGDLF